MHTEQLQAVVSMFSQHLARQPQVPMVCPVDLHADNHKLQVPLRKVRDAQRSDVDKSRESNRRAEHLGEEFESVVESDYTQDFEDVADSQSLVESTRSPPRSARRYVPDKQPYSPGVALQVEEHVGSVSFALEVDEDAAASVSYASSSTPKTRSMDSAVERLSDSRRVHAAGGMLARSAGSVHVMSGSVKSASVELGHVSIMDPIEVRIGPRLLRAPCSESYGIPHN
jgi:hypothetical protein